METDKIIIIKNCTKTELQRILEDWCALYPPKSRVRTVFEIAEMNADIFVIKVDKRIDDTRFFFLVNYCAYPIDFEKTFEAVGYINSVKALQNKKAFVFNNESDPDGDNVWLITQDNETHKFDFGGKYIQIATENEYKELDTSHLPSEYEEFVVRTESNSKTGKEKAKAEKSKRWLKRRFKFFSTLLFTCLFLMMLLLFIEPSASEPLIVIVFFIFGFWLVCDYKIFNDAKKVFLCVTISLLFAALGVIVYNDTIIRSHSHLLGFTTAPLATVGVMWLVNKFIINKFSIKHETYIDRGFLPMLLLLVSGMFAYHVFVPIMRWLGIV